MMIRPLALLSPLLLGACLSVEDRMQGLAPDDPPQTLASDGASYGDGARLAGPAVRCIALTTTNTGNSAVRGDRVIDFEGPGRTYRNVLPSACPRLGAERRIAYRTTIGRLCRLDTVSVLRSGGGVGATCALGDFQPIERRPGG